MSLVFPFVYMLCNSNFTSISVLANPSDLTVIQLLSKWGFDRKISTYTCLLLQFRVVGTFINSHRLRPASMLEKYNKTAASSQYLAVKKFEAMSLTSFSIIHGIQEVIPSAGWIATC